MATSFVGEIDPPFHAFDLSSRDSTRSRRTREVQLLHLAGAQANKFHSSQ